MSYPCKKEHRLQGERGKTSCTPLGCCMITGSLKALPRSTQCSRIWSLQNDWANHGKGKGSQKGSWQSPSREWQWSQLLLFQTVHF